MIKRILVGIDFSTASQQALERAAEWARRLQVPVRAIHVVETTRYPFATPYATLGDPGWFGEHRAKTRLKLAEWLAAYPGVTGEVEAGNPAEVLVEAADPDTLVVIGQVGHSKLERLVFGSTAARVARHASGDVLVVHPAGAESPPLDG